MEREIAQDMRGASSLVVDAIIGVTDLVESMHARIGGLAALTGVPENDRARGVAGLVYGSVRGVTKVVAKALDFKLSLLAQALETRETSANRLAFLAALNGVLGDYLQERANPLAIEFQMRRGGKTLGDAQLRELILEANGRLNLLVHGACMHDLQWLRKGHDHGIELEKQSGRLSLYALYNTGLHISQNGEALAQQLKRLSELAGQPLDIAIIGHSMGGLVARSALSLSGDEHVVWQNSVRRVVCLGSPHQGAILERMGSWVDFLLQANIYSAPLAKLGRIRSAGVMDLRYGVVLERDWLDAGASETTKDVRSPCPLPKAVDFYTVASTISQNPKKADKQLVGDGLVSLSSALGEHKNNCMDLAFPENHRLVVHGANHLDLLSDQRVYDFLRSVVV